MRTQEPSVTNNSSLGPGPLRSQENVDIEYPGGTIAEQVRGDGLTARGLPVAQARVLPALAAMLCAAMLAIGWPGVAMYDTVSQFGQVLSGVYEDWHPPVMARLWSVLHALGPGAVPMFVAQVVAYWTGLGLIAGGLARAGRPRAGWAVLAIGAVPLLAGWQIVVLKDAQMLGALLAAVGLVAWWRLAGRGMPRWAVVPAVVLLGYAMLVRTNGVFAVVPLGVMLLPGAGRRAWRAGAIVALIGLVLAATPAINHRLFGARTSSVAHTLPIFDAAGIAHTGGGGDILLPGERAMIVARHCYQPFFWDPLGDMRHCGGIAERLATMPGADLNRAWVAAILADPTAYARHRLAHLNSTERWLVPARWPIAAAPAISEPNALGLGSPGAMAWALSIASNWFAEMPPGWPVSWVIVAGWVALVALRRARTALRDMALALALSALAIEASFAVFSIASDLRYHLWAMTASALAAVFVLAERRPSRRQGVGLAGVLAFVILAGSVARYVLPAPPADYDAMLGWDGGAGQASAVARHPG